jgi:hypothetical protein
LIFCGNKNGQNGPFHTTFLKKLLLPAQKKATPHTHTHTPPNNGRQRSVSRVVYLLVIRLPRDKEAVSEESRGQVPLNDDHDESEGLAEEVAEDVEQAAALEVEETELAYFRGDKG